MNDYNNAEMMTEISLTTELEPYRANHEIWDGIWEAENIPEEHVKRMISMLADKEKPLVIIHHDDADGITPSMQFRLAREVLVGDKAKKDIHINLATGSSKEACKAIFGKYNIPKDANIIILDLNQDKPVEALEEMGLHVDGRIDHHQVGGKDLESKIVPTSGDKSYIDSTSVLTRAVLEHKKFQELAFGTKDTQREIQDMGDQARLMAKLDNLALLGLIGDKKLNEKDSENRLQIAFEKMPGMLEPYKRIANALNLMAMHPVGNTEKYEKAKDRVIHLIRDIDKIDDVLAQKFEEIEHVVAVKEALEKLSANIIKAVDSLNPGERSVISEGKKDYPRITIEKVEQDGFRGLKVTVNETEQTEDIYDMGESSWKAVYSKLIGKHDLDFVVMAIEDNEQKLPNLGAPREISYRVGTLKPRADIDEQTGKMKKDGLMMSSIEVAVITEVGGGHEERAGDTVKVGETYVVDGEMIIINNVDDLQDLMVKRSFASLKKTKPSIL